MYRYHKFGIRAWNYYKFVSDKKIKLIFSRSNLFLAACLERWTRIASLSFSHQLNIDLLLISKKFIARCKNSFVLRIFLYNATIPWQFDFSFFYRNRRTLKIFNASFEFLNCMGLPKQLNSLLRSWFLSSALISITSFHCRIWLEGNGTTILNLAKKLVSFC